MAIPCSIWLRNSEGGVLHIFSAHTFCFVHAQGQIYEPRNPGSDLWTRGSHVGLETFVRSNMGPDKKSCFAVESSCGGWVGRGFPNTQIRSIANRTHSAGCFVKNLCFLIRLNGIPDFRGKMWGAATFPAYFLLPLGALWHCYRYRGVWGDWRILTSYEYAFETLEITDYRLNTMLHTREYALPYLAPSHPPA